MKLLIILMLLLSVNLITKPALAIGSAADKQVAHVKIAGADADVPDRILSLAQRLCNTYNDGSDTASNIEKIMKNYFTDYHQIPNPTPDQIAQTLNKHRDKLFCLINGERIHYMRYSFYNRSLAFFSLFKEYLSDKVWMNIEDESINIDVNALTYFDGDKEPETVLDYMINESEKLPKGSSRKARIDQVIFIFKNDFNAKTYGQLVEEN
ncbi:hypothetical protein [uncultured Paraglaciecola sp.]|uniref:hypothetical protein n=1 Tax=uncultured Paraglaciecola sp. TaxID=1765024 RepID=UPI002592F807|nr:hypothetical protein [uncultured Paraglaciecola sp.]